jgi:hypothetical protein
MPVANYWNLNQIYIIITAFVIIGFLIAYSVLFVHFQIDVSKDLNTHCENPIAMYFDKASRERCLIEKITKKNELSGVTKDFKKKEIATKKVLNAIKRKIKQTNDYYDALLNKDSPEVKNAETIFSQIQPLFEKIYTGYVEIENKFGTLKTDFETSVNDNIQMAIDVGNNLVDTLVKNTYTKKWKDNRKKMVDSYNKIKSYLSNPSIQPYLDKIKEKPENSEKITKINAGLTDKVKSGPK